MLETSPFPGNPQKGTIFLLRKKQVRVSPPPPTWDYSSYLISALFFISEDKCWTCIIWRKLTHTRKHTDVLSLSLKECEWGGEFRMQSLAHRRQPGARARKSLEVLLLRLKSEGLAGQCQEAGAGGLGGTQKEQDGTLAVFCAGFVDVPESQRETQSRGTQAWPGLPSGNQSDSGNVVSEWRTVVRPLCPSAGNLSLGCCWQALALPSSFRPTPRPRCPEMLPFQAVFPPTSRPEKTRPPLKVCTHSKWGVRVTKVDRSEVQNSPENWTPLLPRDLCCPTKHWFWVPHCQREGNKGALGPPWGGAAGPAVQGSREDAQACLTRRGTPGDIDGVVGELPENSKSCLTEWEGLGLFLVSERKTEAKERKSQRKLCFCS